MHESFLNISSLRFFLEINLPFQGKHLVVSETVAIM